MKKIVIASMLSLSIIAAQSCKFVTIASEVVDGYKNNGTSKDKTEVEKNLYFGDFDTITCCIAANIEYVAGDESSVYVKSNKEIADKLQMSVEAGNLLISRSAEDEDNHYNDKNDKCHLVITSPSLKCLRIEGPCNFTNEKKIVGDTLNVIVDGVANANIRGLEVKNVGLVVNGAANMYINEIVVDNLDLEINGAGNVTVSGEADNTAVSVQGAGRVDLRKLKSEKLRKQIGANGSLKLR